MTSVKKSVTSLIISKIIQAMIAPALLVLLTNTASANNVFHIELIVFERYDRPQGSDDEQWGKNIRLEYPTPWQRLINPEEEAIKTEELNATAPPDDFLKTLENERNAAASTEDTSGSVGSSPKHYEYLPQDKHNLRKTKDALNNSNQLRVLFHHAWTQPLTAPENAPALILHGGNRYGDLFELQGFIRLGISRFVHIETDLWFSQFVPNHGQKPDHWPDLPIEPIERQSSVVQKRSSDVNQYQTYERNTEFNMQEHEWQEGMENAYGQAVDSAYLVKQIITLRQKRRIRTGETHYLDHPRLGVIIKVTPL